MDKDTRELEELVQKIAYKLGHDDYGLKDNEFVLKFWSRPDFRWQVRRAGIIRIRWFLSPFHADFETELRQCLKAVQTIKKTRGTDLVLFSGLKTPSHLVPGTYRKLYSLPPLVDHHEIEVEVRYEVVVKHRETGIVSKQNGAYSKGVSRLVEKARLEISERVAKLQAQVEAATAGGQASTPVVSPSTTVFPECPVPFQTDSYLTTNGERSA